MRDEDAMTGEVRRGRRGGKHRRRGGAANARPWVFVPKVTTVLAPAWRRPREERRGGAGGPEAPTAAGDDSDDAPRDTDEAPPEEEASAGDRAQAAAVVVDCHCHAGTGDGLTGPWDTRASLDRYRVRAARAGIHRTVLFAAFNSDYAVANREVASIVARWPERYYGFAFVHAARDRGRIADLVSTAVHRYGFVGVKVHRHDARITREVCEAAKTHGIPVLYDVAGEVAPVELLAREYPDVDFIIPHLGSFADDWSAQLALIDQVSRHANVYTDTSGVRRFDMIEQCIRRAGPRKVLFGTDGPWLHPAVELAKIDALGMRPEDRALVVGANLLRLLARAQR